MRSDIELWYGFLKLNKTYEQYCELVRKNKSLPKKFQVLDRTFLGFPRHPKTKKILWGHISVTYRIWGDIFSEPFSDFWVKRKHFFFGPSVAVENLSDTWKYELEVFRPGHYNYGRYKESDLDDFIRYLDSLSSSPERLVLNINLSFNRTKIIDQVGELIKARQKKIEGLKHQKRRLRCRHSCPTPNLSRDKVERYLKTIKVFRQGLKGEAAFNEMYPGGDWDTERSAFYADKRKGDNIVDNALKGFFPGNYIESITENGNDVTDQNNLKKQ